MLIDWLEKIGGWEGNLVGNDGIGFVSLSLAMSFL